MRAYGQERRPFSADANKMVAMTTGSCRLFSLAFEVTARACCKTDLVYADVSLWRMASKFSRIHSFNPWQNQLRFQFCLVPRSAVLQGSRSPKSRMGRAQPSTGSSMAEKITLHCRFHLGARAHRSFEYILSA
jgi:hypothetical protein